MIINIWSLVLAVLATIGCLATVLAAARKKIVYDIPGTQTASLKPMLQQIATNQRSGNLVRIIKKRKIVLKGMVTSTFHVNSSSEMHFAAMKKITTQPAALGNVSAKLGREDKIPTSARAPLNRGSQLLCRAAG